DTHRTNLMKKLEVNNIAGLISFAIKNGIVT
ncbi:MAG: DNA-binding response regulator, partial [Bacteroidetes bacterium]